MSRMRSTIAKRLLSVSQETAMLTTFNEVDMQPIKNLRNEYGEDFRSNHGIKLGFMGFFVAASIVALKQYPLANASIDGIDVVNTTFTNADVISHYRMGEGTSAHGVADSLGRQSGFISDVSTGGQHKVLSPFTAGAIDIFSPSTKSLIVGLLRVI